MCVSNEPCRLKEEKSAVLAQSTFRRFYLIGRTLDRAGKLGNPVPARRGKRESKAYRQEAGMQREIHGGNVYGREVRLDFSVNINPLGMPQGVRQAITEYTAWDETCLLYTSDAADE